MVYRYHMRFLHHVTGANKLNMPFYLLKSLEKMSIRARNHPSSSSSNMFHHGLIKLLINQELGKVERSWSHFLFRGGFKVNLKYAEKIKRKQKSSRKKVLEIPDSAETKPSSEKSEDRHEQECPEEITSTRLPEEESGWIKNDNSVLVYVDEIEIVKEGSIHTVSAFKNITEPKGFSFKPPKVYYLKPDH